MSDEPAAWLWRQGHPFVIRVGGNITLLEGLGWEQSKNEEHVFLWPRGKRTTPPFVLRAVKFSSSRGLPVVLLTNMPDSGKLRMKPCRRLMPFAVELNCTIAA